MPLDLEKEKIKLDVSSLSKDIKSAVVISLVVLVIALALTMGPAFITLLYFGVALGGVIAYTMYPEQSDALLKSKQLHLLGATLGFFFAGPLGLLLGAWLVHFTLGKVDFVAQKAQTVQNATETILSPFQYVKNFYIKAKEVAVDVFDVLSEIEPNFTLAEESDDELQAEHIEAAQTDKSESRFDKPEMKFVNNCEPIVRIESQATELIQQPAEPSKFMGWFYKNFYIIPPVLPAVMMPSQIQSLTEEVNLNNDNSKDDTLHPVNRTKPQ